MMETWTRRSFYAVSTALTLSLASFAAQAAPLPVGTNLTFTQLNGPGSPKAPFQTVNPKGWSSSGSSNDDLVFVDSPTGGNDAAGPIYLQTYADPVGSVPGNYVEADGNPTYENTIYRTITGLVPGASYTLSFYQGASQQTTFGVPGVTNTTDQWVVGLGANPVTDTCSGGVCTYGAAGTDVVATDVMTPITGTAVGWDYTSVNLTAPAATSNITSESALLSFLAWGDGGLTSNEPPIAFLSGVQSTSNLGAPVPEPATMSLLGVGLLGLGAISRRRRGKRSTSA
jgi:hypothetical protein